MRPNRQHTTIPAPQPSYVPVCIVCQQPARQAPYSAVAAGPMAHDACLRDLPNVQEDGTGFETIDPSRSDLIEHHIQLQQAIHTCIRLGNLAYRQGEYSKAAMWDRVRDRLLAQRRKNPIHLVTC